MNRIRFRNLLYTVLALWCQYLSLAALVVYALLRLLLTPDVPLGHYSGTLELLWPVSYVLLLTSYIADHVLWQGEEELEENELEEEKPRIVPYAVQLTTPSGDKTALISESNCVILSMKSPVYSKTGGR